MIRPAHFAFGGLCFLWVTGCYGGAAVLDREARPPLSECTYGAAWAECGTATGEPRFACQPCAGGSITGPCCAWFTGDIAEGFVASDCPSTDLCCVGEGAGSAFVDPAAPIAISLASTTVAWGASPWDRSRARDVDVTLAATGVAPVSLTCSVAAASGPCAPEATIAAYVLSADGALVVLARNTHEPMASEQLIVEVIPDDEGALGARICRVGLTDYATGSCQVREPSCAVSGTLTMPSFPTTDEEAGDVAIDLTATFADHSTIEAHLSAER